jgi:hypothetical protein
MPLPVGDLVPSVMVQTTQAVTVDAPPRRVRPWLAQTGPRAGNWWLGGGGRRGGYSPRTAR